MWMENARPISDHFCQKKTKIISQTVRAMLVSARRQINVKFISHIEIFRSKILSVQDLAYSSVTKVTAIAVKNFNHEKKLPLLGHKTVYMCVCVCEDTLSREKWV